MNRHNLLSTARQSVKRRRRATRRWVLINSAYLAVLLAGGGAYAWSALERAAPTAAAADVAKLTTTLTAVRQQSAAVNANLKSVLEITDRPDWSTLLALLAEALGDHVVLTLIDAPMPNVGAAALAEPSRIALTGVARSQADVTQFVLRLEALKLFTRVRLAHTSAQTLRGTDSVEFQVVCGLSEEASK